MYLDNELIETEHICCMAHARAKFKYASDQGGDPDAAHFLDCIGELYKFKVLFSSFLPAISKKSEAKIRREF